MPEPRSRRTLINLRIDQQNCHDLQQGKNAEFSNRSGITPRIDTGWETPHQATALWCYKTPGCDKEPSLRTKLIAHWAAWGGPWQQNKGSTWWGSPRRPSVLEGRRESGKGPTKGHRGKVPTAHTLCREAEGTEHGKFGEEETRRWLNNCLQLFEGQLSGHRCQIPLGSTREHYRDNHHTLQFQRFKSESWKNIFPQQLYNELSNGLRVSVLRKAHPDNAMADLVLCCNSPLLSKSLD